jgi:hypothetical protein
MLSSETSTRLLTLVLMDGSGVSWCPFDIMQSDVMVMRDVVANMRVLRHRGHRWRHVGHRHYETSQTSDRRLGATVL